MRKCVRSAMPLLLAGLAVAAACPAVAAERFFAFNETATTDFKGVYLAPSGTGQWGPNQALNDKDHSLDASERLRLTGIGPGRYDVKLVDGKGRACIMRDVNLTKENSFEIRDGDLTACQ